jgi:hypothetical protein
MATLSYEPKTKLLIATLTDHQYALEVAAALADCTQPQGLYILDVVPALNADGSERYIIWNRKALGKKALDSARGWIRGWLVGKYGTDKAVVSNT